MKNKQILLRQTGINTTGQIHSNNRQSQRFEVITASYNQFKTLKIDASGYIGITLMSTKSTTYIIQIRMHGVVLKPLSI